jgi:hypothetical protein
MDYISLPPSFGNESGPIPEVDEATFQFITHMIK